MPTKDSIELEIEVLASNTAKDDLDRMTRNLLKELKDETSAEAYMVSIGPAPKGSKGDVLATLTMSALPIVLPGVFDMIKAWAARGQGRTVKFKGKGIDFEGSPEDLQKLLKAIEKGKKRK